MKVFIEKENIHILFGKMLPNVNVEEILIHKYEMERNKGLNYVEILGDNFLKNMFTGKTDVSIESFFTKSALVSKTYKILETIDMLLLKDIKDYNFKNIVYDCEDDKKYYFEVQYD